jgi:hypothetical protein
MTLFFKITGAALAVILISGCGTTAKHSLNRGKVASAIRIIDAPAGATIQAGGLAVRADQNGEARLVLEDGWHELYVFDGSLQIYTERVFLQDGSQKLIDLEP